MAAVAEERLDAMLSRLKLPAVSRTWPPGTSVGRRDTMLTMPPGATCP